MANWYDCDGVPNRRQVPEGSGALACVGFSWDKIVELLSNPIGDAAPEVRKRQTVWLVMAHSNGFHIEFFDDDDALQRRLAQLPPDGPQVHAGRLTWM